MEGNMETFIVLINYTGPAIQLDDAELEAMTKNRAAILEASGAKLIGLYRTQGRYDAVAILEAPDAKTITAQALAMWDGTSRVETLRAFTSEEYADIWSKAKEFRKAAS
jgi:uncharacterized protein with GYD domain